MNQSELIERVARASELSQAAAGQAVKAVVNELEFARPVRARRLG
jgi:nucleoid DNA-binding protein